MCDWRFVACEKRFPHVVHGNGCFLHAPSCPHTPSNTRPPPTRVVHVHGRCTSTCRASADAEAQVLEHSPHSCFRWGARLVLGTWATSIGGGGGASSGRGGAWAPALGRPPPAPRRGGRRPRAALPREPSQAECLPCCPREAEGRRPPPPPGARSARRRATKGRPTRRPTPRLSRALPAPKR